MWRQNTFRAYILNRRQTQQAAQVGTETCGGTRAAERAADTIVAAALSNGLSLPSHKRREHHTCVVAVAAQLGEVKVHGCIPVRQGFGHLFKINECHLHARRCSLQQLARPRQRIDSAVQINQCREHGLDAGRCFACGEQGLNLGSRLVLQGLEQITLECLG